MARRIRAADASPAEGRALSSGATEQPTTGGHALFPLLLLAGVALLSGWQPKGLPFGLAPADAFALPIIFIGAHLVLRRGTDANRVLRALLLGLTGLFIANFLTMVDVGFAAWQRDGMQRDFYVVLFFLCIYAVIEAVPLGVRWTRAGFIAGALVSAAITFSQGEGRAEGTFQNPNYAAHYLCTAVVVVLASPFRRSTKVLLAAPLLAGLVRTGSFMALVFLVGVVLVRCWMALRKLKPDLRAAVRVLIILAVLSTAPFVVNEINTTPFDLGSGADSARLARSRDGRIDIWIEGLDAWREHPIGIGNRGVANRADVHISFGAGEMHNDAVSALVELGVIGLAGLLLLFFGLWRLAPRSSWTRALLVGFAISSMTHGILNYRHAWIGLAICLFADRHPSQDLEGQEPPARAVTRP